MYYLFIALLQLLGLGLSYVFFRPYLKRFSAKTIFKGYFILAILALSAYFLARYSIKGPDFFEAGIGQLRSNKYINDKVGDFQSYSFYEKTFKESKNQASFDVELIGKGKVLFVRCNMKRNGSNWLLSEIKLQKLIDQRE